MKKKLLWITLPLVLVLALSLGLTLGLSANTEPTVSIEKMNLAFEDNVYLLYAVDVTGTDAPEELALLVWDAPAASYEKGTEATRLACAGTMEIEGEEYYVFEYTALSAKQMTDDVYTRAYATVDDKTYYSEVEKYSILQYAYNKLGKTDTAGSESLQAMLVQMLEYGASAQEYFGYKTDRLATAEYYQITVVGGTLPDGFTKGLYQKDESITLTAQATKDGEEFGYWQYNDLSAGESVTQSVTVAENATYTAVYGEKPVLTPLNDGVLLYAEDFESYDLTDDEAALLSALGWSYAIDGAPTVSLTEKDGSKQLLITPSATETGAFYLQMLSDSQFTYLGDRNFTYQYDICYTDSTSVDRYIVMLSAYGNGAYDTCHVRYNGRINNEHCNNSTFTRYGYSLTSEQMLSLLFSSNKPSDLQNLSLSIRYVVDWEQGNKVYIRVNGNVPGTTGDWILFTQYKANEATATPNKNLGGNALVLKSGNGITGYVDNIKVWSGTVDAPVTSAPYLSTADACHKFFEHGSDLRCALCGRTEEQIANSWLLEGVPRYETLGYHSEGTFYGGQGLDPAQPADKENLMQLIAGTNATEFNAYLAKLAQNGYTREYEHTKDGNLFASYVKETQRVYAYYIAATGEVRVIRERTDVIASLSDFGYTYTPAMGEGAVVYQYALPMRDATHKKAQGYVDNGMFYVIRLADNSLVFIDGASATQFPETQVDHFMSFLREITGTGETDVIKVAGWYITHPHGDHTQGVTRVLTKYHAYLDLDRVFYNINSAQLGTVANIPKILGYLAQYYADDMPQFLRIHTGQVFNLGDVCFEVLHTNEDMVNAKTAALEITAGGNESSSIVKLTFGGKEFMVLGDIDVKGAAVLMENWSDETLKADMLQVAHHVLNVLTDLYHIIQAPVLMVPQSQHRIEEILGLSGDNRADAWPTLLEYADPDRIFYQNTFTAGIAVVDGELTCVYQKDVLYDINANQTW